MFALVANHQLWWVPVAMISVRELAISMYRSFAARKGISIPASKGAKVKTVFQQFAAGWPLLPLTDDARWLWNTTLWIAVALTLITGARYFMDARRVAIEQLGEKR